MGAGLSLPDETIKTITEKIIAVVNTHLNPAKPDELYEKIFEHVRVIFNTYLKTHPDIYERANSQFDAFALNIYELAETQYAVIIDFLEKFLTDPRLVSPKKTHVGAFLARIGGTGPTGAGFSKGYTYR